MFLLRKLRSFSSHSILMMAVLLSILLGSLNVRASGQVAPPDESGGTYGCIELSTEGIKAVAVRISRGEDEPGIKLIYTEIIRLALGRNASGKFVPTLDTEAAQGIQKLLSQLRKQYKVPADRIYLIGSSELGADHSEELVNTIKKLTGKTLVFLDSAAETQLTIAGTISQRGKVGATLVDNRNSSLLIGIGSYSTKGGYQLLRYSPVARYDFVTMNIPHGAANFTNEISRAVGESGDWLTFTQQAKALSAGSFREALRKERESKPGLLNRKRIYLTGDIAWAMATLLYPEDRQPFVPVTFLDIVLFASRASHDPRSLLNPNLSRINDPELRQQVEKEIAAIRKTFSAQQLMAGTELLNLISTELNWQEKNIWFARFGNIGCILSYILVQAEK